MNRPAPLHIPERILFQWHVTERCNLRCRHCYGGEHPGPDPSREELLSVLEQLCAFVRDCRGRREGRFRAHITLAGGEPFLREDIADLLERLSGERGLFSVAILTNGTLLTPAALRPLSRLKPGFVQVSIDGTRETHDLIRGMGSFERAVAGVKLLVGAGIPTYLSFTAHHGNYREFPAVARLGRRLGAARVWADRMVPCGRGEDETMLTPAEAHELFALMAGEQRREWPWRRRVALHRSLQFTVTGERPYRCSAGDTLVTILPSGDLCPCRRMPLVVGNIHATPLAELYGTSDLFRALRDRERVSSGCEGCFYARTCGGGARCLASAVHGDPFRADPGCWLAVQEGDARPGLPQAG